MARGPSGVARVSAEMDRGPGGRDPWNYSYLVADFEAPVPARVTLIPPTGAGGGR